MADILVGEKKFPVPEDGYLVDVLREAIAYGIENGDGVIVLPPGTFKLSRPEAGRVRWQTQKLN